MIQVKNGKVINLSLPTTGTLSDGRTVSGYDVLMKNHAKIAAQEGWLPEVEVKPVYNAKTEQLTFDRHNILKDKVEAVYKKEAIPVPLPPEVLNKEKSS